MGKNRTLTSSEEKWQWEKQKKRNANVDHHHIQIQLQHGKKVDPPPDSRPPIITNVQKSGTNISIFPIYKNPNLTTPAYSFPVLKKAYKKMRFHCELLNLSHGDVKCLFGTGERRLRNMVPGVGIRIVCHLSTRDIY